MFVFFSKKNLSTKVRVEEVSDYDQSGLNFNKNIKLKTQNGEEKARVMERPSLFSKSFKVKFLLRKP